jgi:phage terminase large subunit
MYLKTTAFDKINNLNKRIRGIAGGTSASKTISILLWLIDASQSYQGNLTSSVVSESMPHLKRGAIRDFINIMQAHDYFDKNRWNKTDFIYDFSDQRGKKILEFFSADQPGKVRGPRRDILFINEANNISYETFTQLEIRTRKIIWLDWNPVSEFWFYDGEEGERAVKDRDDCDFLVLTYKDNEALDLASVKTIEARRYNKNWFRVYGEGLLGEAEGRIYTGWEIIDQVPEEARLDSYGLDFGYTNDPTACDAVYYWNGAWVIDQIIHRKGLSNKQIADLLTIQPRGLVIADSAEPKSIDEIKSYGIHITPSIKGKDSVLQGIQYVQGQKVFITKRSVDTIKEYRNYLWMTDKEGRIINEPSPIWNHHMDAIRYAIAKGRKIEWKPNDPGGVKPFYEGLPG